MDSVQDSENVRQLLTGIVMNLVDRPSGVRVSAVDTPSAVALQLLVAPGDLGKVIGKQGRTARSLRTILSAIGKGHGRVYALDICESKGPAEERAD